MSNLLVVSSSHDIAMGVSDVSARRLMLHWVC